ncbi:MAG TPA: flavoprotein [Thermoanaerobaculia bacterium]|nr:flavoprotein [Thermoanaerobaculia bacterium]
MDEEGDLALKVLCRSLLIGMTGSISAPAIPGFITFLRRGLVEKVRVIMTRSAAELITPATMQAYTGEPVYVDSFDTSEGVHVPHIQLTREADAFVIMPATANIIAKAGLGIADDLLSTAILASPAPVIIVPCMNERMWNNRALQRNVALARENGYHVMEPAKGIEVADMQDNFGVMPPLDQIIATIAERVKRA